MAELRVFIPISPVMFVSFWICESNHIVKTYMGPLSHNSLAIMAENFSDTFVSLDTWTHTFK